MSVPVSESCLTHTLPPTHTHTHYQQISALLAACSPEINVPGPVSRVLADVQIKHKLESLTPYIPIKAANMG